MRAFLVALAALSLLACGGGATPTITAITSPEPAEILAGQVSQVTVRISVTDEDGDLERLRLTLKAPAGTVVEDTIDVTDQAGAARNSTITLLLEVAPPDAGVYAIDVVAIDTEDNESAPSSTSFSAR